MFTAEVLHIALVGMESFPVGAPLRAIAFSSIRKAIGSAACCCHEPTEPPDPRTVISRSICCHHCPSEAQ